MRTLHPVAININLLAHIALDAELNGRYSVQGNTFKNTINYLYQYIQSLEQSDQQLKELILRMEDLIHYETKIRELDHSSKTEKDVEQLQEEMVSKISSLSEGGELLLPGGWGHALESGHAMVYQFKKTESGLRFSIYNAGAGRNTHEAWSTLEGEQFYPVKTYEIPEPIQLERLKKLTRQFIAPQLTQHPSRDKSGFDGSKLNKALNRDLALLGASPMQIASEVPQDRATTGQISGTCTQRSLHQMLKLHFKELADYQKFIFKFKMHALNEFIKTHPIPRSDAIAELLTLAIENNLKLVQIPEVFTSQEQEIFANELIRLKETIHAEGAIKIQAKADFVEPKSSEYTLTLKNKYGSKQNYSTTKQEKELASSQTERDNKIQLIPELINIQAHAPLSEQLDTILAQCANLKEQDPIWVLKQIEKTIHQLPLPNDEADFYNQISAPEAVDHMLAQLEKLQVLYLNACEKNHDNEEPSSMYLIHWSLLALFDHFERLQTAQKNSPSFHLYLADQFRIIWSELRNSPHLASYHPQQDQRIKQLMHYAQSSEKIIGHTNGFFTLHYQAIINSFPKLKKKLEYMHAQREWPEALFHRLMAERGYAAMMYLSEALKTKDPNFNKEEFAPLLDAIQRQIDYEHLLARSMNAVSDYTDTRQEQFEFTMGRTDENLFQPQIIRPLNNNSDDGEKTHLHYAMKQYDYDKDKREEYITHNASSYPQLIKMQKEKKHSHHSGIRKMGTNEIQLYAHWNQYHGGQIRKKGYQKRKLFHLRASSLHQINLTLDDFRATLSKLEDSTNRQYLEKNLFQPGLLKELLERDSGFIQRFDAFIQAGFHEFINEKRELNEPSLFLVRLSTYFNRYLAELRPELAETRLKHQQEQVHSLMELTDQPEPLSTLHQYHFINAMALYEQALPSNQHEVLTAAFRSHLYLKNNAKTASSVELKKLEHTLKSWLQKTSEKELISSIKQALSQMPSSIALCLIEGKYPLFTLNNPKEGQTYSLNLESGLITQGEQRYSNSLPSWLTKNMEQLVGIKLNKSASCFISNDYKSVELSDQDLPTRIINNYGTFRIQKKWVVDGKEDWYEEQCLKNTYSTIEHNLPECFKDHRIKIWVNSAGQALITRENQPIYKTNHEGHLLQFDNQQMLIPCTDQNLLAFENPEFFCTHRDPENQKGSINFVRYDLSLTTNEDGIYLPESTYKLMPKESSPFDPMIACLNFSDGQNQRCIVAVQRAYVDTKHSPEAGDYYPLIHDRTGYIQSKETKTTHQKKEYERTERSMNFAVIDGKPKPNSAAEALYLCYLYLISHQTDQAWAVLDEFHQHFSLEGNATELTYLSWIIKDLPKTFEEETSQNNQDYKLATPRTIACQLKALAILTDHLEQGKKLEKPASFDVYGLYVQHQRMTRHLPSSYKLNDREAKSLLNYDQYRKKEEHKQQQEPGKLPEDFIVSGALGAEWRRLTLKTLLLEYQGVQALIQQAQQSNATLPEGIIKRVDELQQQLNDTMQIMQKRTQLVQVPITIKIKSTLSDSRIIPTQDSPEFSTHVERGIDLLSRPITNTDLSSYLPIYARIALEKDHPYRPQLEQFIRKYLIAYYHDPDYGLDERGNRGIHQEYSEFLYSILSNTENLAQECNKKTAPLTLKELSTMAKGDTELPPIMIYQAQNVFTELLADTQQILELVQAQMPLPAPIQTASYSPPKGFSMEELFHRVADNPSFSLDEFKAKYRKAEALEELQRHSLEPALPPAQQEQEAGLFKYQCVQKQKKLAQSYLKDPVLREELRKQALSISETLTQTLEEQWHTTLEHAHSATQQEELALKFKLAEASLLGKKVTQEELLTLYFHADQNLYQAWTGLSDIAEINKLHTQIHQNLSLELQKQHMDRFSHLVAQTQEAATDSDLKQIAALLMAEVHPATQNDPQLMLFQYYERIVLKPRQIEAVQHLLSTPDTPFRYKEAVEKIIMGGGKSKVILPLLAQKKANGTNLVIIEVPRALLETNYKDLNESSQKLFGQRAFVFDFNRDSDCSPKNLELLHQHFLEVITDKAYLVTTGESMQSLQLSYLELLMNKPSTKEKIEKWQQQVYWLGKINRILKQRSDVIIDEVHQGLQLKKKLNYTLGSPVAIDPVLIRHSIELYEFIAKITPLTQLKDHLLDHPESPLQEVMNRFTPSIKEELRAYLNNESESERIKNADSVLKDCFAFYKEQVRLLPQTLARKHKANYGPSQLKQDNAAAQALAIPYLANNKPNERCRFGAPLETINYSIQSFLHQGLSPELLSTMIQVWQKEARQEWKMAYPNYSDFNQTPTALRLQTLFYNSGYTLQTIDSENKEQIKKILPHFQYHQPTLFEALKKYILPEIRLEPEILHSDAYNHVDLFHSVQGVSGTPSNHHSYHSRLHFNSDTALGTDEYIKQVLKEKDTPIHSTSFGSLDSFLPQVFAKLKHPKEARAFIDINATFTGISNLAVAQALASFVAKNNPDIDYILYFNEENRVFALNVKQAKEPVPLEQLNNYAPEKCFTYYDQDHTVGADLKQAKKAVGVVFVDEKTQIQSLLQGSMRMRGLEEAQSIEIIVPESMPPISLETLISLMEENEDRQLAEENFFATLGKMDNQVREELLQRLNTLNDNDYESKHHWAQAFKSFFVEQHNLNLYQRYGKISYEQETAHLFEHYKEELLKRWAGCLAEIDTSATPEETQEMTSCLDKLIKNALPWCHTKTISHAHEPAETSVEIQKEQELMREQEQQKEQEQEQLLNTQTGLISYTPCPHQPWRPKTLTHFIEDSPSLNLKSLKELSSSAPAYSPQLLASPNFRTVFQEQKQMIGPYMNPVQAILFKIKDNKLTACLINNQEAEELYRLLPRDQVWLSTTQHTLLAGERPDWVLQDPEYLSLIEQIRFFSGEWESLVKQPTPFHWLNEQSQEKLDYFEQNLLPYRELSEHQFDLLGSLILNKVKEQKANPLAFEEKTAGNLPATVTKIEKATPNHSLYQSLNEATHFRTLLEAWPKEKRLSAIKAEPDLLENILRFRETLAVLLELLPEQDQLNVLIHKNTLGRTLIEKAIGFDNTEKWITLPVGYKQHVSLTSKGMLCDVAVSSQSRYRYYLKNWPDTWVEGLEEKQELMERARYAQDTFNNLLASVSDTVRYHLLKIIASETNYPLALELSLAYPQTFKQLLEALPKTERLELLRRKNHEGLNLLDAVADKPELLSIVEEALPEGDRHKARYDAEGNNELHLAVKEEQKFRQLIAIIPKEELLDALLDKNRLEQNVIHLALDYPPIHQLIIDSLPLQDRYALIVDKEENTALHRAAQGDPKHFNEHLLAIPQALRFHMLLRKNKEGKSVLNYAMDHPQTYEFLLDALGDEERYKMFIDRDSGMSLHDSIDPQKIMAKIGFSNSLKTWDWSICERIMQKTPPKYHFYALTVKNMEGNTVLDKSKKYAHEYPIPSLEHFLSPTDKLKIACDKEGNTILHLAWSWEDLRSHLRTAPQEERRQLLMLTNNPPCELEQRDYIPHDFDYLNLPHDKSSHYICKKDDQTKLCYVDVMTQSIIELPINPNATQSLPPTGNGPLSEQELKTITSLTGHTHKRTVLQAGLRKGISLMDVLDELPKSDRPQVAFQALCYKTKKQETLLHQAIKENLEQFTTYLLLLNPEDRLTVLMIKGLYDRTVFELAIEKNVSWLELLRGLPENEFPRLISNLSSINAINFYVKTEEDIELLKRILKAMPKERLFEFLTSSGDAFNPLIDLMHPRKQASNSADGELSTAFWNMLQEVIPKEILIQALNKDDNTNGSSALVESFHSFSLFYTCLSIYPPKERLQVLQLRLELSYGSILGKFKMEEFKKILELLPKEDKLTFIIQLKDTDRFYFKFKELKDFLKEATDWIKKELPEIKKLDFALMKQRIIVAADFYDLKEALEKLDELLIKASEIRQVQNNITPDESTSFKP